MKRKIVILGAGESGAGSAVLALKHGFEVFVSDKGEIKDKYRDILTAIRLDGRRKSQRRCYSFS